MRQNVLFKAILVVPFVVMTFFAVITAANADGGGNIHGNVTTYGDRYAAKVLVFIEDLQGDFEPPEEHAVINQVNTEFVPRMLPVLKGTTVDFTNTDTGWHNVYSPPQSVTPFNLGTYPTGTTRSMTFDNIGVSPISCSMHSNMRTYVITLGNPYFKVTDKMGQYDIKDIPPGTYSLRVWHERLKAKTQKVTIESGKTIIVDYRLE